MALLLQRIPLFLPPLLFFCLVVDASSGSKRYTPPPVPRLTDRFSRVPVDQGFSEFFGGSHIKLMNNGSYANLILDKISGSGLVSKNKYNYGFFSAAVKLPPGFTSGVVVAFYMSNADVFPHAHDEIDIELLGREKRTDWVLQTNIYSNGDVKIGREEKFYLWFDPTEQFHHYSIIWNSHHVVFLVDNIPVREVLHNEAISSAYPTKPMSVYATIWDGSEWATHGGKYPVDYKHAPFVSSFGEMEIDGCIVLNNDNKTQPCSNNRGFSSFDPTEGEEFARLSKQQAMGLQWARNKLMFYSYCKDIHRFKVLPPECSAN
ncbi:probable xyloglucan endotransglucosylase/hydrolase protein 33 [Malania oleifera]|uniref:probable xyloglucan endotransglucosylase/hydrolase protein 33 n=1 Tax=Malania oleifera TaxID=397392 RepID=UPI0025AE9A41|nr:probable xyloglucan endotransglucosylase/hydrolase protein 33 [Malania oleifera]